MKDWRKICISERSTILDVMKVIDLNSTRFAVVTSAHGELIGCVTDGDIRRGLLRGLSLDRHAAEILNTNPFFVFADANKETVLRKMTEDDIHFVPVVNSSKQIIDIWSRDDVVTKPALLPYQAVIMAGGLGSRLGELTANCPKPMLNVGGKPILETVIQNLNASGISEFHISVNYRSDIIESYFGDGKDRGVSIGYIREKEKLGTAGCLSLWKASNGKPFLVMNGDILSRLDIVELFKHHEQSKNLATMCVRRYEHQIPFGVVEAEDDRLVGIEEKPVSVSLVSAGIYVFNNEVIDQLVGGAYLDMPQLFQQLLEKKHRCGVFMLHEYWVDIGRQTDLVQARDDFPKQFRSSE